MKTVAKLFLFLALSALKVFTSDAQDMDIKKQDPDFLQLRLGNVLTNNDYTIGFGSHIHLAPVAQHKNWRYSLGLPVFSDFVIENDTTSNLIGQASIGIGFNGNYANKAILRFSPLVNYAVFNGGSEVSFLSLYFAADFLLTEINNGKNIFLGFNYKTKQNP